MKYLIDWSEITKKGEKNGRAWQMTSMTLKDEQGVVTDKVTTFDTVTTGQTIEGEIVANGQYLNFKKKLDKPDFMKGPSEYKAKQIETAQNNKAVQIAQAQDRSAWMWAKTNAATVLSGHERFVGADNDYIAKIIIDLATKIYNGEPIVPF